MRWEWDGNRVAPTISPSILVNGHGLGRRCHSYVRAGQWQFLADCTHDLAGRTVPMVALPAWLFEDSDRAFKTKALAVLEAVRRARP